MNRDTQSLQKEEILRYLKDHSADMKAFGVKSIGLFGSFVPDEQNPGSDIDFLVIYEPEKKSLKNYFGLLDWLENAFNREIELITQASLSPYIGPHIEKEAEYVSISD